MAKERFEDRRLTGSISIDLTKKGEEKFIWRADKASLCRAIVSVCRAFKAAGDTMTLRQLYYQLVAQDLIPNHVKVYDKLGKLKDDLVYSGILDWSIFEDRGRKPIYTYYEESVEKSLIRTIDNFAYDRRKGQPIHVEVWTEKDAISGILQRVTSKYTVNLVVNKGYGSSTSMYEAYKRFTRKINDGQKVVILYFGDHDPSGLDMVRDINDRVSYMISRGDILDDTELEKWWDEEDLTMLDIVDWDDKYSPLMKLLNDSTSESVKEKLYDLFIEGRGKMWLAKTETFSIKHIGLTMEQIEEYQPPHNPAKLTDPRAENYIQEFGEVSWEVDAIAPDLMREIVDKEILELTDMDTYNSLIESENLGRGKLVDIVDNLDFDE